MGDVFYKQEYPRIIRGVDFFYTFIFFPNLSQNKKQIVFSFF